MIVPATIQYKDILIALDIHEIPGLSKPDDEWIEFEGVDVEECHIDIDCDVCGGSLPEPYHEINSSLIEDFVSACVSGDAMMARALVGRVFEDRSDVALAEKSLGKLL